MRKVRAGGRDRGGAAGPGAGGGAGAAADTRAATAQTRQPKVRKSAAVGDQHRSPRPTGPDREVNRGRGPGGAAAPGGLLPYISLARALRLLTGAPSSTSASIDASAALSTPRGSGRSSAAPSPGPARLPDRGGVCAGARVCTCAQRACTCRARRLVCGSSEGERASVCGVGHAGRQRGVGGGGALSHTPDPSAHLPPRSLPYSRGVYLTPATPSSRPGHRLRLPQHIRTPQPSPRRGPTRHLWSSESPIPEHLSIWFTPPDITLSSSNRDSPPSLNHTELIYSFSKLSRLFLSPM